MSKLTTNMAGNVWKIIAKVGDHVDVGETVVILESMKMEIHIDATSSGIVKTIYIQEGDFVNEGDTLLDIE